jgi:serine/threonine protein kinase
MNVRTETKYTMLGKLLDGRYQVLQVLGGGGFGQTYIANDTHRPGCPKCVVKHLKTGTHNPEFLETARRLFANEATILEQLGHHEQIPRLLAYFEDNEEFFLVQELIQGHSLKAELLSGQRWTEDQVISLMQQVLGILAFIHSYQVIHRDIKPENIIRRQEDGKVVLIDFGAVKQFQTQLLTTLGYPENTVAIGTPGYMSIEQGRGKPRPCSDIYSLGIICIQALTGLSPRELEEDPHTGEIVWQHQANVNHQLASIVSKMVQHHLRERYQTATDVLQALQELLGGVNYQSTQISSTFTPPLPEVAQLPQRAIENQVGSLITTEQYNRLESLLLKLVGPVATTLLRKATASASSYEELIDSLQSHVPVNQQSEFQQKTLLLLNETTGTQKLTLNSVSSTPQETITDSFLHQCEQELTNLIGPIAIVLVQKALKSSPQISRTELVENLARHISNPQAASQFQRRLTEIK